MRPQLTGAFPHTYDSVAKAEIKAKIKILYLAFLNSSRETVINFNIGFHVAWIAHGCSFARDNSQQAWGQCLPNETWAGFKTDEEVRGI